MNQVIVIGGGAAGVMGAIRAKTVYPNLDITILEAAKKPLGKVKISGGGRCNVTHGCFDLHRLVEFYPRGQKALKSVFSRFGPQETIQWFESHGVALKTEPDGRMFPVTDESQTIIDCLLKEARRLDISIKTQCPVEAIIKTADGFNIQTNQGNFEAAAILLSPGGNLKAYGWLSQLGHTLISPAPSLFTFNVKNPLLNDLAGTSFLNVKAKLLIPDSKPILQEGPLLVTHWGLSGPVILRLSAWAARELYHAHYQAMLIVDFLPTVTDEKMMQTFHTLKETDARKQLGSVVPFDLTRRFWIQLLKTVAIPENTLWTYLSKPQIHQLCESLKRTVFEVSGKGPFKEEFVTAGGVDLKEVDFKTMQSRLVPGLFFAGEILDIDGLTGGFNFQNAWSTGWIAGEALAKSVDTLLS